MIKRYWKGIASALLLLLFSLIPVLNVSAYYLHLISISLIWVILTEGLNIIQGLTGYVSIAQASFFGIGAYASVFLTMRGGVSFWLALPLAMVISGIAGLLVGYPSLRTHGHYFSIITLAFCTVIWLLMITLNNVTGGEAGISKIPPPDSIFGIDFSIKTNFYYLILFFAALSIVFVYRLKSSRIGRAFVTIRENEQLAQAIGISLVRYKTMAFIISATLGGLAGCLYAHFSKYINPVPFSGEYSMNAILAVIMGGSGTIAGPVIGSFLLNFLPEYLRIAESFRVIIYGLMLILITIFMPKGIIYAVQVLFIKLQARFAPAKTEKAAVQPVEEAEKK